MQTHDTEPSSPEEKIEWLWGKLDRMNGEIASLNAELTAVRNSEGRAWAEVENTRSQLNLVAGQASQMARELNEARQAAASAVRDHIANTGG